MAENIHVANELNRVRPVLLLLLELAEQFDDTDVNALIEAFATSEVSGFHIRAENADRACNFVGCNKSDQFRMTLGAKSDYDENSRASKDSVALFLFDYNELYELAWAILKWIYKGDLPSERN